MGDRASFSTHFQWQPLQSMKVKNGLFHEEVDWVSISPIFYEQLFHTKVFLRSFYVLTIWVLIFWQKDLGAKADHKMLVKLTPGAVAQW